MPTYTLDLPPLLNSLYRPVARGKLVLSAEGRIYKQYVRLVAGGADKLTGDVVVTMRVYRKRKKGDIDGFLKLVLDAFSGVAYHDDSQISDLVVRRYDDKDEPRLEIEIVEA